MIISKQAYIHSIIYLLYSDDGEHLVQHLPEVNAIYPGKLKDRFKGVKGDYSINGITFVVREYDVLFFKDDEEYLFLDDEDYDEVLAFGISDDESWRSWCQFFETHL